MFQRRSYPLHISVDSYCSRAREFMFIVWNPKGKESIFDKGKEPGIKAPKVFDQGKVLVPTKFNFKFSWAVAAGMSYGGKCWGWWASGTNPSFLKPILSFFFRMVMAWFGPSITAHMHLHIEMQKHTHKVYGVAPHILWVCLYIYVCK